MASYEREFDALLGVLARHLQELRPFLQVVVGQVQEGLAVVLALAESAPFRVADVVAVGRRRAVRLLQPVVDPARTI